MERGEFTVRYCKGLMRFIPTCLILLLLPCLTFGFAGGTGSIDDPYLVETAEHLDDVRNYLTAHFRQIADIDLTDYLSPGRTGYNNGAGWEPIGVFDYYDPIWFSGSYDGDGYAISNLFIDRENELYNYIGLFGYVNQMGQLKNINLINVNVSGYYTASLVAVIRGDVINCNASGAVNGHSSGGLVGYIESYDYITWAEISNSYSSCDVNGVDIAGGLATTIVYTKVEYSHSSGEVRSIEGAAGGLVTGADMESVIEYSYATGDVQSTGTIAGGLVASVNTVLINESYASGNVALNYSAFYDGAAGGLVAGGENSIITNSYATGDVITEGDVNAGGLAGIIALNFQIENSYSSGRVAGDFAAGGLVGYEYHTNYSTGCYWDIYNSGMISSALGEGKITPEMLQQATYSGWDFNDIWQIDENDTYPYLRNNLPVEFPSPPQRANDLGALCVITPELVFTDSLNVVKVIVYNMGSNPQNNFSVRLMKTPDVEIGNQVVSETLDQYEQLEIEFIWSPSNVAETMVWGEVALADDEFVDNDLSVKVPVRIYLGFDRGEGTAAAPYQISHAEQLLLLKYYMDAHFELVADIDCNTFIYNNTWHPLGYYYNNSDNHPFMGHINGNNHTISNVAISEDVMISSYVGFIAYLGEDGVLENIILEDITISGWFTLGGLVGLNEGLIRNSEVYNICGYPLRKIGGLVGENRGEIENSSVDVEVHNYMPSTDMGGLVAYNYGLIANSNATVDVFGGFIVGGLVAKNYESGIIIDSYSEGALSNCNNVGGLVGYNHGEIINSYSLCSVNEGLVNVGGLVGRNYNLIENCFYTGDVNGEYRVAGLVGENRGTILNSYNQGNVMGIGQVGGLVGCSTSLGAIENTYSSGLVLAEHLFGGLIGDNHGIVVNSYWDINTSGQNTSDGGEGRTTEEMMQQITYQNWDFENIWQIIENESYPFLFYQEDPVSADDEVSDIPQITKLIGNHPNPFNPETTILFYLSQPGNVTVEVFNIIGQRVRVIKSTNLESGEQRIVWDGKDERSLMVSSGVFFYRLVTEDNIFTSKMLMLK